MTKQQLEARISQLEQQAEREYALRLNLVRQLEDEREYARRKVEEAERYKLRAFEAEHSARAYLVWLCANLAALVTVVALWWWEVR